MNCEGYRDKLIAALASGESALGADDAMHLRACAECKKFCEAQVNLFGAIDSGIRGMVNETVPASLLPRVRSAVAESDLPRRSWGVSWGFAAVAIAAVLAIGVGFLRRSPESSSKPLDRAPVVAPETGGTAGVTPAQRQVITAAPMRHSTKMRQAATSPESPNAPEVLVLAEERAAFVRFVSDLPEEREVAVAFTRPANEAKDEAVEIALLQIDELEMKPLEPSNP